MQSKLTAEIEKEDSNSTSRPTAAVVLICDRWVLGILVNVAHDKGARVSPH